MIEKLIERKKIIEDEIFTIECADRLSWEERRRLYDLNDELLNVQNKIEKGKIEHERSC